jgi:biotin transport system substrate-specific component
LSTFAIGIRRPVLADVGARTLPGLFISVVPVLVGTALTAAAAQVAFYLPGNPVPITGQTFGVLVVGAALGPVRAVASALLYVFWHRTHRVHIQRDWPCCTCRRSVT